MRFRKRNKHSGLIRNILSLVLGLFFGLVLGYHLKPDQLSDTSEPTPVSVTEVQEVNQPKVETKDIVFTQPKHNNKRRFANTPHVKRQPLSKDDKIRLIAKTIWCENNASEKSMRLTMSVIYNRTSNKTLDGAYKEISRPGQFDCFKIVAKKSPRHNDNRYRTAIGIVEEYIRGEFTPLINARYFYNPNVVKRKPQFAAKYPLVLSFENHDYH